MSCADDVHAAICPAGPPLIVERTVTFGCSGEQLVGIISLPTIPAALGLLIIVGGPQYRVGSHRQFVLLARRLSTAGFPVMRFDYRGMGDSTGSAQTFEDTVPDITAALSAFQDACPVTKRFVLWGLCDAASAALLYRHATADARVKGVVLVNPWIRSDATLARTHVKHYYRQRIVELEFWKKLMNGNVSLLGALRSFSRAMVGARRTASDEAHSGYQRRMAEALETFPNPALIVLSGRDWTAKEFVEYWGLRTGWPRLLARENVECAHVSDADHSFSTAAARDTLETLTLDWLRRSFGVDWSEAAAGTPEAACEARTEAE